MKKVRTDKKTALAAAGVLALLGLAFVAGALWRGAGDKEPGAGHDDGAAVHGQREVWTCSMHPQIRLPRAGQCPICFMDLIPLDSGSEDETGSRVLSVGKNAAALMDIELVPVERRFVAAAVRMVGKVDFDETRVSSITAWVPGRLDRLFVDYTGIPVNKGDHMVEIYSAELLSAQEELIQAVKAARTLAPGDAGLVSASAQATVQAVREKLRLWGLTPEQIKGIESRGEPDEHVTIYAPAGGIVVEKAAQEGMYVNTGTRIYTIADLSRVWVNLDAYASDLAWLRYGQEVAFTTEAHPGATFTGSIAFIHPVLDEQTRTVKVRVNVENKDNRLKPGMFVRAVVRARIATGGRVMDAALAGKWISPMHPEVVKDAPGACDVCGMPLVPAESLGYVGGEPTQADMPLVIPASAPLLTGKRAIVYVQVPGSDPPTFEGRELVLGPRGEHHYVVPEGLEEGELVVAKGAFKIDAELQIRAKPSMMTPADGDTPSASDTAAAERPRRAGSEDAPLGGRKPQTHCPVMGGAINKAVHVDYEHRRIYFCCAGCEGTFLKDPEAYLEKMRAEGIEPERIGEHHGP
jgi:Cu(I)/Ag(I) efflux system membrane fusion protein